LLRDAFREAYPALGAVEVESPDVDDMGKLAGAKLVCLADSPRAGNIADDQ
jgi:hypothetical protein